MKQFLTGLIGMALSSWLFAQEVTNFTPVAGNGNTYHNNNGTLATEPSTTPPFKADYKLIADLGFASGGDNNVNGYVKAEVINGVQLSPEFYLGIGTGIRNMTQVKTFWDNTLGAPMVPIYLDARLFLSKGNVSPYLSLDAGYSFDVSFGVMGLGMMLNPMAGVRFGRKHPFHLGAGYNSQWLSDSPDAPLGAFAISGGVTF